MKKIVRFAIDNPVTILMIVCAVLLLGKISYDRLGVDLLPDINNPKLFIELEIGERPPEDIEKNYVEQIEAMAVRQNKVTNVSSEIHSGSARITVEYAWSKDMDDAYIDLQKAINPFLQNSKIDYITITQHDPNSDPVAQVALYNDDVNDMSDIRKIAENYIRTDLIRVDGIAEVTISGAEYNTLAIKTDPYKLKAFGLSVDQIASTIENNNKVISGGRVSDMGINYLVKGQTSLIDIEAFQNLIVGYKPIINQTENTSTRNIWKAPIYLKEVANITYENAEPNSIVRLNGKRCIGLSIYKEREYNTVKAVNGVKDELISIEKSLPGYKLKMVSNQGSFIENSINEVKSGALIGILLAVIVLFFFLRAAGTTLIISLAMPISIIATFSLMYFTGLSLNIMTLGGLALGAGMLVDNAIVVIESIFRNRERGLLVKDAAVRGTSEVAGAIISSTLTTIVVFLPIVYLHGASGELFKDQAWTVTFSLVSSLLVAIFVIPTLYNTFYRNKTSKQKVSKSKAIEFTKYKKFLKRILTHKWLVIAISTAILIATFLLLPLMGTEFMPSLNGNVVSMKVKLSEGTRLERTATTVQTLEEYIYNIAQDSSTVIYSHIGSNSADKGDVLEGENSASIKVILPKDNHRMSQIIAQITKLAKESQSFDVTFKNEDNNLTTLFNDESSPIVIEIKGDDLDKLDTISNEVVAKISNLSILRNITTSNEKGAPEIDISLKREIAGINNITATTIVSQIQDYLEGRNAGKIESFGEMKDIIIKLPKTSLEELKNITITQGNKSFLLQEIANLDFAYAPKEILRRNQHRICKINADIRGDESLDKVAKRINSEIANINLPENYSIKVTGEEEMRQKSLSSLILALLLSIVLVYMVMASQFESLLHPFTILLTIPLAGVGAVLLFIITGHSMNIMGLIGVIMLAGIAVNNSILLVDRTNQLKATKLSLSEAIVEAGGQRIRPILMTTATTILALLPLTFSFGEATSLRSPMAIAVIGGLITSTLMSLIVIPCVYYVLENTKQKLLKRRD